MSRPVILVVASLISAGCKPHVTLKPPAPNLTAPQRVQFFEEQRAVSEKMVWSGRCAASGCQSDVDRTLNLANGSQVHHPEDLLPVLSPHSDSAKAIRSARSARTKSRWWGLSTLVFASVAISGAWSAHDSLDGTFTDNEKMAIGIGAAGTIISAVAMALYRMSASSNEARAYRTYNDGLADTLKVCVVGVRVVPCEEVLPDAAGF